MSKKILVITPKITNNGITAVINSILENNDDYDFTLAGEFFDNAPEIPAYVNTLKLPPQEKPSAYYRAIKKAAREGGYDAAYIHGNNALMFLETLAVKAGGISKVIAHCHNSSAVHKAAHHILKPIFNSLVSCKIACSEVSAKWAYNGKDVIIIPNGIDAGQVSFDAKRRAEIRMKLGLSDDCIMIGNFGRPSVQKNQTFILDILKEVLKIGADVRLIMFGRRGDYPTLDEMIKGSGIENKVIMLLPEEYSLEWYNALDAMLMPSIFEGLSLCAIEAQANGLPLIISDHLSPETYATKYSVKESLGSSAAKWAETMLNAIDTLPRGEDMRGEIREAGLTEEIMLSEISKVIYECVG